MTAIIGRSGDGSPAAAAVAAGIDDAPHLGPERGGRLQNHKAHVCLDMRALSRNPGGFGHAGTAIAAV
jgi:hypothetical protein